MMDRTISNLLALLLAIPVLSLPDSAQAEEPDWQAIEAASRSFARETRRRADKARVTLSTAKIVRKVGKRPRDIFAWIKENIEFEAYGGALRGARGTLIAGSGNSVDQAILAVEMLREAGHTVRYVRGRVFSRDAEELIKSFAGEATLIAPAAVASGDDFPTPDLTNDVRFTGVVTDHVWVEVKWNEKWVPFDPVLAPSYGIAKAEMRSISDDLFEDLVGSMKIEVKCELEDGQERTLATIETSLADIAYEHVAMTFVPDRGRPERFHAVLTLEGKSVVSDESLPRSQVKEMKVEVNLRRGRLQTRFTETLISDGNRDRIFGYDQQAFDISVFPGWMSAEAASYFGDSSVSSSADSIREHALAARKGEALDVTRASNRAHRDMGFVLATAYTATIDRIARELAFTMGVEPIFGEPRIVTTAILRRGAGYDYRMNVHGEGLTAVPKKGVPLASAYGFVSMMGHIRHEIEGALLSELAGENVLTVKSFFDSASEKRVALKTIGSTEVNGLRRMKLSSRSREAIKDRVQRKGDLILLTTKPVKIDGEDRRAWWSLNPESGRIGGSLGEQMLSTDSRPEANDSAAATAIGPLALSKRLRDAIDQSAEEKAGEDTVCDAMKDLQRLGGAFCATKKSLPLPSARECAESVETSKGFEAELLNRASCSARSRAFRCGVTMSKSLLTGDLTALYTDQDIMKDGEMNLKKSSGRKAAGLTCSP